ncbi:dihydroneopterin aldolase [Halomonas sabkhae]|uniref:dihydroneopterin aldolase n=1 Tax=Halomonas sabkhae TaxID=626223 RepID=UPI0025B614E1|nr:dihydroneopterin aldolase [Halomonas sabkhae]MDN3524232.1 dihydroneopterin aldolase [Halomonas sabkhae]
MDLVLIESLRVDTVIGVYDWERTMTQTLVLDLELATDIRPAAADDAIDKTLDYAAISERIAEFAASQAFELVETFAERLAERLREEFNIPWLGLTVRKPGAVPTASAVGVRIERGSREEAVS